MSGNLIADLAAIGTVASRLENASRTVANVDTIHDASWSGSAAVASAIVESARIRTTRAQVIADALQNRASGVRDAVTSMVAADNAAARAVAFR